MPLAVTSFKKSRREGRMLPPVLFNSVTNVDAEIDRAQ